MFPSFQWPSWSSELSLYPTTIYLSIIHSIWRKKWQPLLVFLPVEFYGQRSLECYSPWYKELDTTEHAHTQYTPTSSLYSHVIFPQLSFIFVLYVFTVCCCYFVTQLCLTLCNPTDCSPPGSSVHGILPARIPKWVVIPFSRWSFWLRGWTSVPSISSRFFAAEPPGKPWWGFIWIIQLGYIIGVWNFLVAQNMIIKGKKQIF